MCSERIFSNANIKQKQPQKTQHLNKQKIPKINNNNNFKPHKLGIRMEKLRGGKSPTLLCGVGASLFFSSLLRVGGREE